MAPRRPPARRPRPGDLILRKTHCGLDGKPFCETWLSWNGKREKSESCKHCKQGKSSESSKNCQSRGASTTRSSNARAARAARASTQQACMIAGARVPRGAATQERQEQPEHQHSKRVYHVGPRSRAARARLGGSSWENHLKNVLRPPSRQDRSLHLVPNCSTFCETAIQQRPSGGEEAQEAARGTSRTRRAKGEKPEFKTCARREQEEQR